MSDTFYLDENAYTAWQNGVSADIHAGQTATATGSGQAVTPNSSALSNASPTMGTGTTPAPPTATGVVGGPNPESIGTPSDPNLSNTNPSAGSVLQGMQSGPGTTSNCTCGVTDIGCCIKQVEQWSQTAIETVGIYIIGIILISFGLLLIAKETNVGQSTIREFRNAIPK